MKSTQHHPVGAESPKRATIPVCHCGQDLDFVRGTHCIRCGITLHVTPDVALAA
jgi:hypothetical protein